MADETPDKKEDGAKKDASSPPADAPAPVPSTSSIDPRAPKGELGHKVDRTPIEREMTRSYIDYSMSVIVGRALPDARDGLKPVHRRILHTMNELGLTHSKAFKKSVRVVGDVLGKYHPHGDLAVYDALVRMAQDFSLRYLLVEGQGNFGSVDGDSAAAMRYTECRMSSVSEEMLADIDSATVDMVDNFDGSFKEPTVLPSRIPNLLVNGSSGIAVGMSTNIPPHNMNEVVDGIVRVIDDKSAGKETTAEDLMEIVKGPDFPTGGLIYGVGGVRSYISTGRGKVRVRAKTHFEEVNDQKTRIIVTEIPYQVNKTTLLETIASLVREKKIDGITNVNDESDREGMRIVIDLRRDAVPELILTQLFAHTELQTTFGIIMLALINNQPKVLDLREAIQVYIDHRFRVIRRRSQFLLDKANARLHILEGLLIALDNLDEVLKLIRKSKTGEDAENALMSRFLLSEEQAKAILAMRLQKLTGLESESIRTEAKQVRLEIEDLEDILKKDDRVFAMIKADLLEVKEKYGDDRRTQIITETSDIEMEDLIPKEMVVVTITDSDYIKRLPLDTYKSQRRGGKGLIGMETKEEDNIKDLFVTHSHNQILYFTNKGRVFWLKAYNIPEGGRHAKGKPIINLLPRLEKGERVHQMIPVHDFLVPDRYLVFATKKGKIKKTVLSAFKRPMVSGIWAIKLAEDDELIETRITDGKGEIVLASKNGQATRFSDRDIRAMGRHTQGVIGMRLRGGDEVVSMAVASAGPDPTHPEIGATVLLTLTENGFGKRSSVLDYRKTKRGGRGVRTIKTSDRNGKVVKVLEVAEDNELIITSVEGMVIRLPVSDIRLIGRMTSGVCIMKLEGKDKIVAIARLVTEKGTDRVLSEAPDLPHQEDPDVKQTGEEGAEGE